MDGEVALGFPDLALEAHLLADVSQDLGVELEVGPDVPVLSDLLDGGRGVGEGEGEEDHGTSLARRPLRGGAHRGSLAARENGWLA